jgi:hypothetical protein
MRCPTPPFFDFYRVIIIPVKGKRIDLVRPVQIRRLPLGFLGMSLLSSAAVQAVFRRHRRCAPYEIARHTRESLPLVAETVGWVWATISQVHRIPAIRASWFIIRAKAAQLQELMRHVSPHPADVRIKRAECVHRWAV